MDKSIKLVFHVSVISNIFVSIKVQYSEYFYELLVITSSNLMPVHTVLTILARHVITMLSMSLKWDSTLKSYLCYLYLNCHFNIIVHQITDDHVECSGLCLPSSHATGGGCWTSRLVGRRGSTELAEGGSTHSHTGPGVLSHKILISVRTLSLSATFGNSELRVTAF